MSHQWHTNANGSPKTHRRPRTCESCREHPKGGCALPFRKMLKVRWLAAMEKKPHFFKGAWLRRLKRANAD